MSALQTGNGAPYVIAEVGQNHNGSTGLARELIRLAGDPRPQDALGAEAREWLSCSAVKFTKRYLREELSRELGAMPYTGPHSYGQTYAEHRRALELTWPQLEELSEYQAVTQPQLGFGVTVCHQSLVKPAMERVHELAFLKVASRDIENEPLLQELAMVATGVPKIVSLGMATAMDVERILRTFHDQLDELVLMHCRSIYPAPPESWDLQVLFGLQERMEPLGVTVGYSDHAIGNAACVAAVAMGALVIEKHVTLDRRMKGSDHLGSADRGGLYRLLRDLKAVTLGTAGDTLVHLAPQAASSHAKLGRSLAWNQTLLPGTEVSERHLALVSPGSGMPWSARGELVGQLVARQVEPLALCAPADVA